MVAFLLFNFQSFSSPLPQSQRIRKPMGKQRPVFESLLCYSGYLYCFVHNFLSYQTEVITPSFKETSVKMGGTYKKHLPYLNLVVPQHRLITCTLKFYNIFPQNC